MISKDPQILGYVNSTEGMAWAGYTAQCICFSSIHLRKKSLNSSVCLRKRHLYTAFRRGLCPILTLKRFTLATQCFIDHFELFGKIKVVTISA